MQLEGNPSAGDGNLMNLLEFDSKPNTTPVTTSGGGINLLDDIFGGGSSSTP